MSAPASSADGAAPSNCIGCGLRGPVVGTAGFVERTAHRSLLVLVLKAVSTLFGHLAADSLISNTTDSAQPAVSAEKSKGFSKTMKSVFGNGASSSKTASANKAGNASKPVDANKPASPQDSSNEDVSSLPSGVGYGGFWVGLDPGPCVDEASCEDSTTTYRRGRCPVYERYFRTLADLLPRLSSANEFDVGPSCPDLIQAILTRSPLLVKAAELLRNNCIDDNGQA